MANAVSNKQPPVKIIFFGSTTDSVIVFKKLFENASRENMTISCVVTQPPRPTGRKQIVTPTPVEILAREKNIPVLSFPSDPEKPSFFQNDQVVIDTLAPFKADLLVSASYGQMIPPVTLKKTPYGGLNVHPSILPRWRGADPVPWAILSGDHQIGVTVVTLSENFDEGKIIAQQKIPILKTDFSDPLRARLFELGADLLITVLPEYISGKRKGTEQHKSDTPYAKRFIRDDGFESWENIVKAFENPEEATRIDRKFRALHPWPGLWTTIELKEKNEEMSEKRLKILELHIDNETVVLDTVQLEGKNPVPFAQFQTGYLKEA